MEPALLAAATGMAAQQQNLDTIADDLANADVAGYKSSAQLFGELVAPGGSGVGTVSLGTRVVFTQGKLENAGGPCDVAIEGPGFFAVTGDDGRRAYTREGSFSRAADGTLRNAEGLRLDGIRVPADALGLHVLGDGTAQATFVSGTRTIGRVRLAEFSAPDRLQKIGGALFIATPESGVARMVVPGAANGPKLHFGMLERSSVSIVDSMMRILTAQRAYEANAKGVQAADEMLRIANNLQRG